MADFCSKCGKILEKDGFCMKCIEFPEKNETMQNKNEIYTAASREQPYADNDVIAYDQIPNDQITNDQLQIKTKSRVNFLLKLLMKFVTVGICVTGIFVVSRLTDKANKKIADDDPSSSQTYDEIIGQGKSESDNVVSLYESFDEGETDDALEDSYVYEADYEEIMQAGEPSNAYTLFAATKDDVAPVIDEYFTEQGLNMIYKTDMDNTFEMVEDEKVTYYETFSMWSENEDDSELYFISSDTVTGKLLYVGVYREDNEEAVQLIKKSLETIDPSLDQEQLQLIYDNIINSSDYVDEICGDYEVQGGYLGEEQNLYYYYIVSLLDN